GLTSASGTKRDHARRATRTIARFRHLVAGRASWPFRLKPSPAQTRVEDVFLGSSRPPGQGATMAAMNKCLARHNKSQTGGKAPCPVRRAALCFCCPCEYFTDGRPAVMGLICRLGAGPG